MAFSKAPSISTHQTKDVKLLWALDNREASKTKDVIAKNGFFDVTKQAVTKDDLYTFIKRDGVSPYLVSIDQNDIRGTYYWEDQDKLFVAYLNTVAIYTGSTGTLQTTLPMWSSTTGDVVFTEFYYDDGSTKLVVGDGSRLWTIDSSNTAVETSSPDLPTPYKKSLLFLDGYLFLVKEGTSDIYNSNLNDPLAWTAGDFITAEMIPDTLFRIARLSNYLVALGSASVEYFFDAGNASGSPLQRNDTPVKHVGFIGGFASHENQLFFMGQAANTSPTLYILEDFKIESVEHPILRRYFQKTSNYTATIVSMGGHVFYILTVDDMTFSLDIDTKVWTRLGYQLTDVLAAQHAVMIPLTNFGYCSVFSIKDKTGLFFFKPEYYTDNGVNYQVICQTPKNRFDSMHEKYMSRLLPVVDKTTGMLQISWTDDDYQTYSTPRSVDLSIEKPMLHRLGRFVERALKFVVESSSSFRMYHAEIDYNIGLK